MIKLFYILIVGVIVQLFVFVKNQRTFTKNGVFYCMYINFLNKIIVWKINRQGIDKENI